MLSIIVWHTLTDENDHQTHQLVFYVHVGDTYSAFAEIRQVLICFPGVDPIHEKNRQLVAMLMKTGRNNVSCRTHIVHGCQQHQPIQAEQYCLTLLTTENNVGSIRAAQHRL